MSNYEPRKLKRAVIKEEYIVITGDMMESVILNQMIYWSEKVRDFDQFIVENVKNYAHGKTGSDSSKNLLLHGWIYKSADQLKEEIMSQDSTRTINRKLDSLVSKEFLLRRRNPKDRYDHKYQYRVNFGTVLLALDAAGYALEGYSKFFPVQAQVAGANDTEDELIDASNGHSGRTNGQIVKTRGQNVGARGQIGATKRQNDASERHGVATIAETIPEITTETISEMSSSISPSEKDRKAKAMDDDTTELNSYLKKLSQIRHQEATPWMRDTIANLWLTRRIGRELVPVEIIRSALSALTPQVLDTVIERVGRQSGKGEIAQRVPYVQRAILNAGQDMQMAKWAKTDKEPTYDIKDYIDFSMQRLLEEKMP